MDYFNSFIQNAKYFAKNPLSIIALFISLIYGFACLVLGTSNTVLDKEQRWPLIWFIVVFPFIVLLAFVYLVVRHHEKLYAPSDYKDENNFLKTLDIDVQKERLTESVKAIENETVNSQENNVGNKDNRLSSKNKELRQSYFLAEELVLRQLEIEIGTVIKRQSGLKVGNELLQFDGIGSKDDKLILVEVKYTRTGLISIETVRKFHGHLLKLEDIFNSKPQKDIVCILAIVHEGNHKNIDETAYECFKGSSITPRIVYFNINELKNKFGID